MVLERISWMAVAERVTLFRERHGWSKNELARRAQIGVSTVSRIESGIIASPGVEVLRKLADALGVQVSEITGERPMPRRRAVFSEATVEVPVMRVRVQAGAPVWDDTRDTVVIAAREAAGRPNIRAAVVTGKCMEPYVMAGETVVFDPDVRHPADRDMVVVTDEDGGTLVKWFRLDELGRPYLRAADDTEIRPNGAKLEGVVLTVERRALRDPEPAPRQIRCAAEQQEPYG
jgi:transcriptional regulator with XRE-family HTH domain